MKIVNAKLMVDEELLKKVYSEAYDTEEYCFSDAFKGKMGCVEQSGIRLLDWTIKGKGEGN